MDRRESRHLLIAGTVQGVGYRYSMRHQAKLLGLAGWCRNLPDGRVEAVICGLPQQVSEIIAWCHQGPSHARVDSVKVSEWTEEEAGNSFEIRK